MALTFIHLNVLKLCQKMKGESPRQQSYFGVMPPMLPAWYSISEISLRGSTDKEVHRLV